MSKKKKSVRVLLISKVNKFCIPPNLNLVYNFHEY